MPDRDVFYYHVDPRWRSAARRALTAELTEREIELKIIRPACEDFKSGGFPGLSEIIDALRCEGDGCAAAALLDRLETVRHRHLSKRTDIASRVARLHLRDLPQTHPSDAAAFSQLLAREAIVEYVSSQMFSGSLLPALIEEGTMSFQEFRRRSDETRGRLRLHPGIDKLAQQLLEDSTGSTVTIQRSKARKPELAELLHKRLTLS